MADLPLSQRAAMDHQDETWATFFDAFGQLEPHDALIDVLLDDAALSAPLSQPIRPTLEPASEGHRAECAVSADSSPHDTSEDASASPLGNAAIVPSTTARKRIRHSRPSQEIQRLRQTVADLESRIALHRRRNSAAVSPSGSLQPSNSRGGDVSGVWQNVAARQYKFLRDAQVENQQLRDQVQAQLAITKSLVRLIHRAGQRGPTQMIPRSLAEGDAGIITHQRQHLFSVASDMYTTLDTVFAVEPFTREETTEFRETVVCQHKGATIPPGTLLAGTSVSRFLPRSLSGLSELLWNVNQSDQAFHDAYKLEHREESSHSQSFVYSVNIRTPYGPVVCHGVGLRVRYLEADREIVVTTGSMWPDSTTPSPRNAVAYDFKEWVVVRPISNTEDGIEQNQVLVRFETSRPSHPHGGEVRSHEQVTVLQHFIAQAHNFIVEQEQRQIDTILLGHTGDVGNRVMEQVHV